MTPISDPPLTRFLRDRGRFLRADTAVASPIRHLYSCELPAFRANCVLIGWRGGTARSSHAGAEYWSRGSVARVGGDYRSLAGPPGRTADYVYSAQDRTCRNISSGRDRLRHRLPRVRMAVEYRGSHLLRGHRAGPAGDSGAACAPK